MTRYSPTGMLWLKAIHVVAIISWMAGLLYVYRLFVYHAMEAEAVVRARFEVMERRLLAAITFPSAAAGVVTYKRTYAPGEATSASPITEVVINTDTITNDNATTATAANTVSRALISGVSSKAAGDTLTVTWTHTLLGA